MSCGLTCVSTARVTMSCPQPVKPSRLTSLEHALQPRKFFCVFETAVYKPDPTSFGYVLDDEWLLPIAGHNPLPEEYTACCGCKKCERASCSCKLKGVLCTRFCDCNLQEESLCGNIISTTEAVNVSFLFSK